MKKSVKVLGTTLMVLTAAVTLAACGSKSGASKEDKNTISLISPDHSDVHPKNKDLWMWKQYQKKTGVKVNWEQVKDWDNKKQLILSRKTLPDGFYQTGWSNEELTKYGSQGLFKPLEKLIPKYAPNLAKLMEKDPSIAKAITSADGHIYSLPYMSTDPLGGGRNFKLYINKNWLKKLNLKKPTNTTELANVLEQFVTKDPNGNGKADEQGFYMDSGQFSAFELMIKAAFGMNTAGRTAMENNFYIDDNDQLQYIFTDDKMKQVWEYEAELYKKGLIAKTAFSGMDYDKWVADAAKDKVGLFAWVGSDFIGASSMNNYEPIAILNGPDGKNGSLVTQSGVMGTSAFIITKDADEAKTKKMLKWVDYFYSKEGSDFGYFGKEGVTYNVDKNGNKVYVKKILDYPKGAQLGAYQYVDNVYAGFFPYLEVEEKLKSISKGLQPEVFTDDPLNHMPKQVLPSLQGTVEEANKLSTIQTDMNNYVDQARVKFVTGKWDIDKQWDAYKTQLKKIGVDEWVKIRRAQYKRYESE
ncbi:type 2 periplasmic-binding domain-containing protein [Lacticaseibacillus yichunensis]|uniref:ABC transporter substrate-binding protein n=1 Tax=Lacticaseibacillus yichunensis TaxID=2486015 RepID=A0ABW4CS39_9LACO|nr:ABC transporter substrate-binding protein [Lacticaseibacillus yichunensis]